VVFAFCTVPFVLFSAPDRVLLLRCPFSVDDFSWLALERNFFHSPGQLVSCFSCFGSDWSLSCSPFVLWWRRLIRRTSFPLGEIAFPLGSECFEQPLLDLRFFFLFPGASCCGRPTCWLWSPVVFAVSPSSVSKGPCRSPDVDVFSPFWLGPFRFALQGFHRSFASNILHFSFPSDPDNFLFSFCVCRLFSGCVDS